MPSSSSLTSSTARRGSRSNAAGMSGASTGTRRAPTSISDALGVEILEQICRAVLEKKASSTTTARRSNSEASTSSPSDGSGRLRPGTPPSTLLVLDSRWHLAASRVLYETLTLPDDDDFLLLAAVDTSSPRLAAGDGAQTEAEGPTCQPAETDARSSAVHSRTTQQLRAVNDNDVYAGSVRSLRVIPGKTAWRQAQDDLPYERSASTSKSSASEEEVGRICLPPLAMCSCEALS